MKYLPIFLTTIAGLSTLLGLVFILIKIKEKNTDRFISIMLSFSSGVIISISLFDIIPVSTLSLIEEGSIITFLNLILFFLIGYYLIYIFSKYTSSPTNRLYRVGIISFFILIFHNVLEGIATYMISKYNINIGISFTLAIIMHNIPEGILICVPLYYSGNRNRAIQLIILSSVAEPFGALISYVLFKDIYSNIFISYLMIMIAGLMISLVINEILPELKRYNRYLYKNILFFIIGGVFILINILIL